jgi:hypothetical protein
MQLCIRMTCGRTVLMECDASDTVGQLEDAVTAAEVPAALVDCKIGVRTSK